MRHLILTSLAVFTVSSCHHPLVRVDEREFDTLSQMTNSPLLSELPADEPVPELHASGGSLTISDDQPFDMSFRGTDLRVALDEISQRAGITMIANAGITGSVDLNFVNISLDDALSTLLKQHDLVLLPGPGNVYFVERNDDPTQVTEFIQLVNVRAQDVAENLAALVGPGSKVITDMDRNLVCLIGRQSDVGAVRRYLHHVDKLKDQVLLEVHIFEVSYEDGFNLGAVADASGTVNGNAWNILSAFGQGSAFSSTLTDNDGDLDLTVDAMRRFVGLELVSSPRVLAVTNTKAMVDVVQEVPYVQVTATTTGTTGGAGSVVQEEVQFKDAGIKLEITPSIQEAGFLQIDIMQQTSEEVDRFNNIPVIDKRTLTTQFLVQDRETIVLGGLIQTRHSESRTGVPFLMHIPILGQLFRGDADVKQKQEILIFVTPRILSPSQAAKLSEHYQDEYRETRQDLFFPEMGTKSPMEGPRGVDHETAEDVVQPETAPDAVSTKPAEQPIQG
tara:strand:+ start:16104 stop:17615 length:1512 start_codon:yes stop_codon:yes gene_type:complete